ncbi:MAG TPA: hypothetical protein DEB39_12730 [Planctomycetaceae bacterium]|nr:hypothetical protein [Planctomycetaceae bacterium]
MPILKRLFREKAPVGLFILAILCAFTAKTFSAERSVFLYETQIPAVFKDALKSAGYVFSDRVDDASLIFVGGRFDEEQTASVVAEAVRHGKTVVLDVNDARKLSPELNALVPFNSWSLVQFHRDTTDLDRKNVALDFPEPIVFETAYDLHLPGSSIGNVLSRYEYENDEKPLNNADWRILATTRSGVPILITGRTADGKVYVLGASWNDKQFAGSPGAKTFCERLLADVAIPFDHSAGLSDGVELFAPQYQPDGLFLEVSNPADKAVKAVVGYQITNWEREILNAGTLEVALNAGEKKRVALAERADFKGKPDIKERGSSLPYRRIRAGVLSPDRLEVRQETRWNVLTARPVAVSVVEKSESWPQEEFYEEPDGGADGNYSKRFVWPTGSSPELIVMIGNRFRNIAPLAAAQDEIAPDNPSIEGLNDLSLSRAQVRRQGKWQGGWCGGVKPEQRLSLAWPAPVVVAGLGLEVYGTYRFDNRSNPKNLRLSSGSKTLLDRDDPAYTTNGSVFFARCFEPFAPQTIRDKLELSMTKFGAHQAGAINLDVATNCSIKELEVHGWPVEDARAVDGEWELASAELSTGRRTVLKTGKISLAPYSREEISVTLPAVSRPGPVRYEIVFRSGDDGGASSSANSGANSGENIMASYRYDVLYIEPGHREIVNKKSKYDKEFGLLCTPGWVQFDSFGRGMVDWTQGWGGAHDKTWALVHGLVEAGAGHHDLPARMLTVNRPFSHYTNPWRYLPDEETYGWDITMRNVLKQALEKKWKRLWIVGSDRWNGIPINATFGWDAFIRFDKHLRETTGSGLKNRGRKEIADEINREHADAWQRWHLEEYAKKIRETKTMFADHGIEFMFETHGSFPLAGGELGDRLAETHAGVGTDLFWELRRQDLYWSLASRFPIVAVNPNLESGMYKQWGWINSEANRFWFANNGPVEPSRRQWIGTYFMGRVDSSGAFLPYHVMGYSLQGGISTKFYPHELEAVNRMFNVTRFVRPEEPAGYGFIVSWDSHERRMTPKGGRMGFGLYASGSDADQIDYRMGKLYEQLIKNGLPIGFVSSSHALKKWNGKNPLVLLDASDWRDGELETVARLNDAGAPVIGFGGDDQGPEALKFWTENSERRRIGATEYFVRTRRGRAPLIYCPQNGDTLPGGDVAALVDAIMAACAMKISCDHPLVVNPFISHGALFLGLGTMSDVNRDVTLRFDPGGFMPRLSGKPFKVVDLETFEEVVPNQDGSHTIPFEAVSGKILMIAEKK